MKNSLLLSINVGLLVSYALKYRCHGKIYEYEKDLTGDLLCRYKKIKNERMTHFIVGLIVAIVVSFMYCAYISKKTPIFEKINVVVLFMLILPIIIYKVLPKSDYMLKHSQSNQDYKDWFNIYLCMKNKCVYGFLTGFCLSMLFLSFTDIN